MRDRIRTALAVATLALLAAAVHAQELAPRSYWPAPKGTKALAFGYSYQSGDVVTDPSLPVVGVDSRIHAMQAGYFQTLNAWGRTANIIIELPYMAGTTEGTLEGQPARRDVSGVGDLEVTFNVNILGAPTLTPEEFQELRKKPRPIVGAGIKILAPTGVYENDKLINIGTNRWAFKIEVGSIVPLSPKWLLELEVGGWFFGDNDEFLGTTREQDPLGAFESHLVRRIKPSLWVSVDFNYYAGGRTTVGGVLNADLQRNSRFGVSFAYPIRRRQVFQAAYSTGVVTESGGDFDAVVVSYLVVLN